MGQWSESKYFWDIRIKERKICTILAPVVHFLCKFLEDVRYITTWTVRDRKNVLENSNFKLMLSKPVTNEKKEHYWLGKLKKKKKNPMASSGLEPAAFQFVSYSLNQLCCRVPPKVYAVLISPRSTNDTLLCLCYRSTSRNWRLTQIKSAV
jgi:hypothetical protein